MAAGGRDHAGHHIEYLHRGVDQIGSNAAVRQVRKLVHVRLQRGGGEQAGDPAGQRFVAQRAIGSDCDRLGQPTPEQRVEAHVVPADETEHRFRVIEDEPVDYPVCQPLKWGCGRSAASNSGARQPCRSSQSSHSGSVAESAKNCALVASARASSITSASLSSREGGRRAISVISCRQSRRPRRA